MTESPQAAVHTMTPREIVQELDKHIVGQADAKRAVAVALRNRWRRQQVDGQMRAEIHPKNILMIGPTGVGKTEIARRLAKLANAPFVKVEATKFTEVGYVGKDVDSIIRDLVDAAIKQAREQATRRLSDKAELAAEERILDVLLPPPKDFGEPSAQRQNENGAARQVFRKQLREGKLDDTEIELKLSAMPTRVELMGPPGMEEMTQQLQSMFANMGQGKTRQKKMKIRDAFKQLVDEEAAKLVDEEAIKTEALKSVEEPLVEGSTVSTKQGSVKTDHILFIASGAFHLAKPSDLIPELQGRLPIRVELDALKTEDFLRILTEPDFSLTDQYKALMRTEGVEIDFTPEGLKRLAEIAFQVNERTENIGARRLHTVLERLMEEIAFEAPDRSGTTLTIDAAYVNGKLDQLAADEDLSRYIL